MTEISKLMQDLRDPLIPQGELRPLCLRAADALQRSSERTDDAVRAEKFAAQLVQLQKGIQDYLDGNYGHSQHFKSKNDKCPHGLFAWESCENCIDEHFSRLLAVVSGSTGGGNG